MILFRNKYFLTMLRLIKKSNLSFLKSLAVNLQQKLDPNNQTLRTNKSSLFKEFKPSYVYHRTVNEINWFFNLNDHIDYNFFLNDVWDVDLIEISKKILTYKKNKDQEIFCIDIGTHIGTWTIPISFHSDFVISFEPASETFYRLEYNLKLNNIKNVFPFRSAIVPIKSSILELHFNTTGNSGKSSLIKEWSLSNVITEKVLGIEAGTILQNLSSIAIIKIDTEGYEFSVLSTLGNVIGEHHPVVIFEWRSDYYENVLEELDYKEKVSELLVFFDERDYVLMVFNPISRTIDKFDSQNQYENVYCVYSQEVNEFIEAVNNY